MLTVFYPFLIVKYHFGALDLILITEFYLVFYFYWKD